MLAQAGVNTSDKEWAEMEVGDFGLGNWPLEGAQIVTFVNTAKVGFKVICLLPGQTLPEHWHTGEGTYPGKEETLRVLAGTLELGLPGESNLPAERIPAGKPASYTCRHTILLKAPGQITLQPGTKHWLRGGGDGAVVYSLSTLATCARDPFTDPEVRRFPAEQG